MKQQPYFFIAWSAIQIVLALMILLESVEPACGLSEHQCSEPLDATDATTPPTEASPTPPTGSSIQFDFFTQPMPMRTTELPLQAVLTVQHLPNNFEARLTAMREKLDAAQRAQGNYGEGHSGQLLEQFYTYVELGRSFGANTRVCEIGMNLGHSALAFLFSNPTLHYTAFSLDQPGTRYAQQWLIENVCDGDESRIDVVYGDSTQTVPMYAMTNAGACDVLVIDGGHTKPVPWLDTVHMCRLAKPDRHMLVFDDVGCRAHWCLGPHAAWNRALLAGMIYQQGCWGSGDGKRGFCYGRYAPNSCQRFERTKVEDESYKAA